MGTSRAVTGGPTSQTQQTTRMKLTLLLVAMLSVLSLTWALPLEEAEEAADAIVVEEDADLEGAESRYYPSYNYRPRYYKPHYYYKPRYYKPRRRYSYSHW